MQAHGVFQLHGHIIEGNVDHIGYPLNLKERRNRLNRQYLLENADYEQASYVLTVVELLTGAAMRPAFT